MKELLLFLKLEKATIKYDGLNDKFDVEGPDIRFHIKIRESDSEEFVKCLIDTLIKEASK